MLKIKWEMVCGTHLVALLFEKVMEHEVNGAHRGGKKVRLTTCARPSLRFSLAFACKHSACALVEWAQNVCLCRCCCTYTGKRELAPSLGVCPKIASPEKHSSAVLFSFYTVSCTYCTIRLPCLYSLGSCHTPSLCCGAIEARLTPLKPSSPPSTPQASPLFPLHWRSPKKPGVSGHFIISVLLHTHTHLHSQLFSFILFLKHTFLLHLFSVLSTTPILVPSCTQIGPFLFVFIKTVIVLLISIQFIESTFSAALPAVTLTVAIMYAPWTNPSETVHSH